MNCPESIRAEKGDPHCEQSLTTHDDDGLIPFSWLVENILFSTSWFKHRMTRIAYTNAAPANVSPRLFSR